MYINYLKVTKREAKAIPMDKFTTCIDVVISKSIEAGKPIDANEAKNICVRVEKV